MHRRRIPVKKSLAVAMGLAMGGAFANTDAVGGGPTLSFDFTQGSIVSTRGGVTPTFTRATTKTIVDWEGRIKSILSGEVPFDGQRRVANLISTKSEDLTNGAWGFSAVGATVVDATHITFPSQFSNRRNAVPTVAGNLYRLTFDLQVISGNTALAAFHETSATADFTLFTADNTLRRYSFTFLGKLGGGSVMCGIQDRNAAGFGQIFITRFQVEDVTGQSNQNPSEYTSVGVLAAPYHGANVDGVKYFRTLNGNTVSSNVVTEATGEGIPLAGRGIARLPLGTSYFSTPDSVANSIVGDIDMAVQVVQAWPIAISATLLSKDDGAGNRCWALQPLANGLLRFFYSTDGSTARIADTTVTVASVVPTGTIIWLRCTYASATGVVTFYYSQGGTTWTQLGAMVTITAGAIFNGTNGISVGGNTGGGSAWLGDVYNAKIYNGINGTLVVDFNPSDWTTGNTFVSSITGETWTLNGGAKVNKWPVMGYRPDVAATNLVLQSEDFSTTWSAQGTPTRVAAGPALWDC
jgi:hypothetical protein